MIDTKDVKTQVPPFRNHNFSRRKIILKLAVAVVVILVIWQVLWSWGWLPSSNFPSISGSDWQAVFLNNNQVYFGHLSDYNQGYAVLKNIFYLRVAESLQQGATPPESALSLVKLGSELHGPQDLMYIPKNNIMFWEDMRKDSQGTQAINSFLTQQKK